MNSKQPLVLTIALMIIVSLASSSVAMAKNSAQGMSHAMVELMATVAEMNDTATRLTDRLHYLETHLEELRTKNEELRTQNRRLAKALKVSSRTIPAHAVSPLDGEVRDANHIIDSLVSAVFQRFSSAIGLASKAEV